MDLKSLLDKGKKINTFFFFFVVFAFFIILYTRIVPLVIFNMDDWAFLSYGFGGRTILPKWGGWNPSRVMPEILMPFVTQLSVYLIYPIKHDFLGSIELGMAIAISAMVTTYAYCFYRMIRKRHNLSCYISFTLTVLFLLLHFLIFRTKKEYNDFLLNGHYDATTYFFYLVPALLNASLVLIFCPVGFFSEKLSLRKRAFLLPAVYFAAFSNIHQSIILAVYVCFDMLNKLIDVFRKKDRKIIKSVWKHMVFLLVWVTSLIFENSGGRANGVRYKSGADLIAKAKDCLKILFRRFCDTNTVFVILFIGIIAIAIILLIVRYKNRKSRDKQEPWLIQEWNGLQMLFSAGISLLYVYLICCVSMAGYIERGDVLLSVLFFIFMFMIEITAIVLNKTPKIKYILPALLVICMLQIPTSGQTLKSSINNNIQYQTARAISRDIVNAYVDADRNNENNITIEVPKFSGGNWPLTNNGPRISAVLYKYHIISKPIDANLVPTPEKNKEYGLPEY